VLPHSFQHPAFQKEKLVTALMVGHKFSRLIPSLKEFKTNPLSSMWSTAKLVAPASEIRMQEKINRNNQNKYTDRPGMTARAWSCTS
jgi:BarA-like signal transduction histidine kinase